MTRRSETQERKRREQGLEADLLRRAQRRIAARQREETGVWSWVSLFGLVGWSVAIPTLIGTGIGLWLDERFPGRPSWTITLMIVGVVLGCLMAWRWMAQEQNDEH